MAYRCHSIPSCIGVFDCVIVKITQKFKMASCFRTDEWKDDVNLKEDLKTDMLISYTNEVRY